MRLDILFFLGYTIEEQLPWHATLSRTRQLFPASVFEYVFTKVLSMCVDKGMHRAAIAYNLKKCLKFIQKRSKSKAKAQGLCQQLQKGLQKLKTTLLNNPKKLIFHCC